MIKKSLQYVVGAITSLLTSVFVAYAIQLAYAHIYANRMGVPLNALSEDYNLGFETFLVSCSSLIVTLVAGAWLTHRIVSSNS